MPLMNRDTTQIKIIQYNVGRKLATMSQLLRHPDIGSYDVIAIQEPYIRPDIRATHNPNGGLFHVVLPPSEERPRVCLYIHRGIDMRKLRVHSHDSRDMISITIEGEIPLAIHNIYNPHTEGGEPNMEYHGIPGNSVLPILDRAIQSTMTHEQVVVGDFNLHHECWSGPIDHPSPTNQTTGFINVLTRAGMDQCLPVGTITRLRHRREDRDSTIDLIWATEDLRQRMRKCQVQPRLEAGSDHKPVETVIQIRTPEAPIETRRSYKAMDTEKYQSYLRNNLRQETPLRTREQVDQRAAEIARKISEAIEVSTPEVRIHRIYTKPDFCREVQEKIQAEKRARRRWQRWMDDDSQKEYKKARREKRNAILQANRRDHRERVSQVDSPEALWKLAKWVKNKDNPRTAFTPEILYQAVRLKDWEQKATAFASTFFPAPPPADLSDIRDYTYPPPVPCPDVTEEEVQRAIRESAAEKAPGPDQIPNRALKAAEDILTEPLQKLFNACIRIQHCPQHFKHSTTVVIPKPGKATYRETKSYRPIALMNTIGKMLDSVIATRLQYYAENYQLLPRHHTGGRKATSCEHALHLLVEKVHTAWGRGEVASLLMLDVTGAFDNVSHQRLLHNLRKRHIHPHLVGWLASYLSGRTTEIRLKEGTSSPIPTDTGIPQGSPLSPILYLFYNADLLDIGDPEDMVTGYIDDTSILVTGKTKADTATSLATIHRRAAEWAKKTGSVFAPHKYVLIHFAKNRADTEAEAPLVLPEVTIQPSPAAKLLGVVLDKQLTGLHHAQRLYEGAMVTMKGFQAISGSTWGITLQHSVQLYKAVLLPKLAYASTVWFRTNPEHGNKTNIAKITRILESVQKEALKWATGAWRTTALAALEIETNVMPIELYIRQRNANTLYRIKGSDMYQAIMRARGPRTRNRTEVTPLQAIEQQHLARNRITGQELETIEPIMVTMASPWWTPPESHVASSKGGAIRLHRSAVRRAKRNCRHALIYTDGSEIQGQVGAAAWCPDAERSRTRYMGDNTQSTVYSAELTGLELALQIGQELEWCNKMTIFTDNQAAIQAVTNPRITSGQYITHRVIAEMEQARRQGIAVTLQWIPSHTGIRGNEEVDELAKQAGGWCKGLNEVHEFRRARKYQSYSLRSAIKRAMRVDTTKEWETRWENGKHGREYYPLAMKPHRRHLASHGQRRKALSAVVVQMKTGKIGLNSYLHGIRPLDTPTDRCRGCAEQRETLHHVLLDCPSYRESRQKYWGNYPPNSLREILSDTEKTTTAARQLLTLGLLAQFSRVAKRILSEPERETDTRQISASS